MLGHAARSCLHLTPDVLVAYQQYDPGQAQRHHLPDNYILRYRVEADRVVVASSGIPQAGYRELHEGQALVTDQVQLEAEPRPALVVGAR